MVKSIQMSIILMYEVTGKLWERPRKLKGNEKYLKIKKILTWLPGPKVW